MCQILATVSLNSDTDIETKMISDLPCPHPQQIYYDAYYGVGDILVDTIYLVELCQPDEILNYRLLYHSYMLT